MGEVRIVGCGNSDRGDDAAGLLVARRLRELAVEASEECHDALSLIGTWPTSDDVTIIDSVVSGARPGTIKFWDITTDSIPSVATESSTHGFGIAHAIELARILDQLPGRLRVYGIEGSQFEIGAPPSPAVLAAVESLAQQLARAHSQVLNEPGVRL